MKFYKRKINESKKTKKNFKKRDLKYLSWGRAFQITDAPAKFEKEKEEKINEIDKKIENIAKMDLISYIKHINREEKEDEEINKDDEDDDSTIDEIIDNILKLKNKKSENKKISYKIRF